MGRPIKLDAERQARVVQAILDGASIPVAAKHGGIGESTHYQYVARGEAALADDDHPTSDTDLPFVEYARAIENARREWELRQLRIIQQAAEGQPWRKTKTVTEQKLVKGEPVTHTVETVEEGVTFAWTASAWLLERRYPQVYGRIYRTEISGPEGAPIEVSLEQAEADALAKVDELEERRQRRAS